MVLNLQLKTRVRPLLVLPQKSGTRPDDNYIKVKSATKKGYEIAEEGDSINLENPNSETRRGRVGKSVVNTLATSCNQAVLESIQISALRGRGENNQQTLELGSEHNSNSLTTVQKDNLIVHKKQLSSNTEDKVSTHYRIRKLTPRECFRLMDFPDTFNISEVSNTQAYKQAGNSIVVSVLEKIIAKLCFD